MFYFTVKRIFCYTDKYAAEVTAALKARISIKPARVVIHPDGGLDTRSEHKSKRVIDERNLDYNIWFRYNI